VAAAAQASVELNVFHNRRWDADIRTLAAVLSRGDVGIAAAASDIAGSPAGPWQDRRRPVLGGLLNVYEAAA
jgi:predicted dehydrogenase